MEDFDYQYIKKQESIQDLSESLDKTVKNGIENKFIENTITKFKEISRSNIRLNFIDNWKPFSKGFFAEKKENNLLVNLNMLGSGYEMIFSLIYSFYLSKQSGKQLIAFIDEPELHLHPSLQGDLVKFLLEISKESQIILTSQSPLFIKQLSYNKGVCIYIFQKNNGKPELVTMDERVLPYVSANEINYLAFGLPTAEFHNELYGFIQTKAIDEDENNAKELNFDGWLSTKGLQKNKDWVREVRGTAKPLEKRTAQTYIRNSIHHPENTHNKIYSDEELKNSIEKMIQLLRNL